MKNFIKYFLISFITVVSVSIIYDLIRYSTIGWFDVLVKSIIISTIIGVFESDRRYVK